MVSISEAQSRLIRSSIDYISNEYQLIYKQQQEYLDLFIQIAPQILELIAGCDAPYHNLEHTINVVLVGQEILTGRHFSGEIFPPEEWLNYMISLLCHDIGYVKGICRSDRITSHQFATGINQECITLNPLATGASLTPHHVDRGKLFVLEKFSDYTLIDLEKIQKNIEMTRFPVPKDNLYKDTIDFPGLARGADLIGQLSDPGYLGKLPALFSEFQELGSNKVLGYSTSQDLRTGYPKFYWNIVSLYIQHSIRYLEITQSGRAILENLYGNRARVEKELDRFYRKQNIWNGMFDWLKDLNITIIKQL
ncbi:MAG: metal-dependent phosphohydrolase [Leptolyngbyaceae cyanobacterium bins.302]|nr:metal-dependent phosphohydrolase [Leptolyngbyaceae cyanobacterium bins.302]